MCKFKKWISAGISFLILFSGLIPLEMAHALTIKEEEELAEEFLKAVFENYEIIKDPVIEGYLDHVGQKLISAMPQQPITYKFYAVRQDAYNAFAGPGGNIFIFSGLFAVLENEDELAALLSHEIAHVSCRHISEMMEKSKKAGMATLAGVIAGILIGLGGAGTVGGALTVGSMATGQSMALAYSRENEMQADQIGRANLQKAGYSLGGLQSILKKIRATEWFGTEEYPTYLRTHPATEERILYLDNLLEKNPPPPTKKNYAFARAHTRITALYTDPDTALGLYKKQTLQNPEDAMAHYGYGLALNRQGNPKAAMDHLKIAIEKNPNDADMIIDLGIALFTAGEYEAALKQLERTPGSALGEEIARLYAGRAMMALGRHDQAADTFTAILKEDPDLVEGYFYLGEAEGKRNRFAGAHFNLGEYYLKTDDLRNARFHFTKAMEYEKDPARMETIRQRLKEMESRHRFFGGDDKAPGPEGDEITE
ncbi:MAG: hypothetical protein COX19_11155 [Desulfobacterales bacterium CG23_combo_of_CG06-09_8_20_14_all_51_8]|nr:MAG: hypothetical protein COX19_11155 [Desulfobacterales bacterium CG23_combo_of_CG06-09_8_20_14_all_51_8]